MNVIKLLFSHASPGKELEMDPAEKITGLPALLRYIMVFIDRVGFPVLAFLLMFYIAFSSNDKMTKVLQENTSAMVKYTTAFEGFQTQVLADHRQMLAVINEIWKESNTRIDILEKESYGYQDMLQGKRK